MLAALFNKHQDSVARDADRLIGQMGEQAFSVAGELSWREDAGLLVVERSGHWGLVQAEIARRTGEKLRVIDVKTDRRQT